MARIGGGGGPETGLYGTFTTTTAVTYAVNTNNWPGVAAVAGEGQATAPYTYALTYNGVTVDQIVENAYASANFWWMSMWTVSGPASSTLSDWYTAGQDAGSVARSTILDAAQTYGYVPAYVVLDPEGAYRPSNIGEFSNFFRGWAAGITANASGLTPAFYVDQSQWTSYDLNSLGIAGFVAVSPIVGNTPYTTGSNLVGYMGYYGTCSNGSAATDVNTIDGWGANMNTLQFSDSGDDCSA